MAIIDFGDAYQSRLIKANQAMMDAYASLDPTDEDYFEKISQVSDMAKEVNTDFKNYADIKIEEASLQQEKKTNLFRNIISAGGIIVTLVTFLVGEHGRNARIDKVAKFEDENAVLKMSERTAVQDCIRDDNGKRPNFFGFLNR